MTKPIHIGPHKYERVPIKRMVPDGGRFKTITVGARYKCQLPGCSHFLPDPQLLENKLSLCWGGCGDAVRITKNHIRDLVKKPMCDNCKAERKALREKLRNIA